MEEREPGVGGVDGPADFVIDKASGEPLVGKVPPMTRHLGRVSNQPVDRVDLVPWKGKRAIVTFNCEEFTSICPVTGQPDFARLVINYIPRNSLIETKSLKLYLWRFREERAFNEVLVDRIADELFAQSGAERLEVTGEFNPRGGISVTCTAVRPLVLVDMRDQTDSDFTPLHKEV